MANTYVKIINCPLDAREATIVINNALKNLIEQLNASNISVKDAKGEKVIIQYDGTDGKLIPNITISDISKFFDGSAASAPTVECDSDGDVSITYEDFEGNVYEDPMVSAGTYKVVVDVEETDTYKAGHKEATYSISKSDQIPIKAYNGVQHYELGAPVSISIEVWAGEVSETMYSPSGQGMWTTDPPTEVGTYDYIVSYNGDPNYISKDFLNAGGGPFQIYDGEAPTPIVVPDPSPKPTIDPDPVPIN